MTPAGARQLGGRRIVVTRPAAQSAALVQALEERGAEVFEFPTVCVEPLPDLSRLDTALERLSDYLWTVFTSVNGVEIFFRRLRETGRGAEMPAAWRVAAIGPATAAALARNGVEAVRVPDLHQAEGLLHALSSEPLAGSRVLLPRAETARELLPRELRRLGAEVTVVPIYRSVAPQRDASPLRRQVAAGRIDAITFTSASTVRHFLQMLGPDTSRLLSRQGIVAACIGPITAATAAELGLENRIVAARATAEDLAAALAGRLGGSG